MTSQKKTIPNLNFRRAWNDVVRKRTHVPVAIVGAGIGSLYCASQIESETDIVIFESSPQVGGRIRTVQDGIDRGAWRVHTSHLRMQKLAETLGIKLEPTLSSQASKTHDPSLQMMIPKTKSGLSAFQQNVLEHGLEKARSAEQYTGYLGLQDGLKRTYQIHTKSGGTFQVPEKGMSEFPLKLAASLVSTKILLGTRIVQMDRENDIYWLCAQDRDGVKSYWSCDTLILGCQPVHVPRNNFSQLIEPICRCIDTRPLTHVYADLNKRIEPPIYHVTGNALAQIISVRPKTLMVSYSGGQLASLHFQQHLQDPKKYKEWIQSLLAETLGRTDLRISKVRVFYYEHAVGIWRPNFTQKSLMKECAVPHVTKLPNLYWINENISESYQGWAEGSLEVAEFVLKSMKETYSGFKLYKSIPKKMIVIDGRVLDVEKWSKVHPGGLAIIRKHFGKDVTDLFYNIHSTKSGALNLVLPLQVGFVLQ